MLTQQVAHLIQAGFIFLSGMIQTWVVLELGIVFLI